MKKTKKFLITGIGGIVTTSILTITISCGGLTAEEIKATDLKIVNAITSAEIKTAIEKLYSDKSKLPSATAEPQTTVLVKGATVAFTVTNNDATGEKNYAITSITKNNISRPLLIGLNGKVGGFLKAEYFLNSIQDSDIKNFDNVGTQYSTKPNVVKNLRLINPTWVSASNLEFDRNKFSHLYSKAVTITLKQNSLRVDDEKGTIEYVAVVDFSDLVGVAKEITVNYDNLPQKHTMDPTQGHKGIMDLIIVNDSVHKQQYYLNKWIRNKNGDLSWNRRLENGIFANVDVSAITKWPNHFNNIDWTGVIGLTKDNTPFKGDLSQRRIYNLNLSNVNVTLVTSWPSILVGFKWDDARGLSYDNTPFKDDISSMSIYNSSFANVDVGKVAKWPSNLYGINWRGIRGLTKSNTPFKEDISLTNIASSILNKVDVKEVKKWPRNLNGVNWEGIKGLSLENTPFQGDLSKSDLYQSILKDVNVEKVAKWPSNLYGINWSGVVNLKSSNTPFQGNISTKWIFNSKLEKVNVSAVTKWPNDLRGIDWKDITGLNPKNTPFKDDLSFALISDSLLMGVDVNQVRSWPIELNGIDWTGVKNLSPQNNPFQGDMYKKQIYNSTLFGVDVSKITMWPDNLNNIKWKGVICDLKNKPSTWSNEVWNLVQRNK